MTSQNINLENYWIGWDNQKEQDKNCPFTKIELLKQIGGEV